MCYTSVTFSLDAVQTCYIFCLCMDSNHLKLFTNSFSDKSIYEIFQIHFFYRHAYMYPSPNTDKSRDAHTHKQYVFNIHTYNVLNNI